MAKGSYNISVPNDSNLEKGGKKNNEAQERMKSCLGPAFLRSLSLHDRPLSSREPTNKELRKRRYKALVSTSLEKIPSNTSPPSEEKSECSTRHGFESARINAEAEVSIYDTVSSHPYEHTGQSPLSEPDNLLEDECARFSVESEKLLEKTVALLRTVDKDISESLIDLTKPASIALEPVMEIYRNKGKSSTGCSGGTEFDLPTESLSYPIYENWQPSVSLRPKETQSHSTPGRPRNMRVQSSRRSPKIVQAQSTGNSPKNVQSQSTGHSPKNVQAQFNRKSQNNVQTRSNRRSPKNIKAQSFHPSPKITKPDFSVGSESDLPTEYYEPIYENWQPFIPKREKEDSLSHFTPEKTKDSKIRSGEKTPKNIQAQSAEQIPENLLVQFSHPSPLKNLLVHNSLEIMTNFPSVLSLNSGNVQRQKTKSDSDEVGSLKQSPRNQSSFRTSVPDFVTKVKSIDCSTSSEFDLSTDSSSQPIYEDRLLSFPQRQKHTQAHSTPRRDMNLKAQSPRRSPKNAQTQSSGQSPMNVQALSNRQSSKNVQAQSNRLSPKNIQAQSNQQSPKNILMQSSQQSPKNLLPQSSQQSTTKVSLVQSVEETVKKFESLFISGNTQSLTKLGSNDVGSIELIPKNLMSSPSTSVSDDTIKVDSPIEFDLPSDHEQFIKIMGALQNRCLEYREMVQDIAVSALEECLNFSEFSIGRIQHLRRQFLSQKSNFRDFKELCCESVVFGPDSHPIDEKVTEVIQSFYLKLLQEENETFMARLDYGLKMGEVYAKMLKFETESRNMITTLEREILYLKKTSVGFKV